MMDYVFSLVVHQALRKVSYNICLDLPNAPNTACSRLAVGTAFSSVFCGFELVPAKWRYLVPPQAANAGRSAATINAVPKGEPPMPCL
jgi:hypothetical protein